MARRIVGDKLVEVGYYAKNKCEVCLIRRGLTVAAGIHRTARRSFHGGAQVPKPDGILRLNISGIYAGSGKGIFEGLAYAI